MDQSYQDDHENGEPNLWEEMKEALKIKDNIRKQTIYNQE